MRVKKYDFFLNTNCSSGIYPDPMHNIDLSTVPDMAISCLLDWTDSQDFLAGPNRSARLQVLYENYREFIGNDEDRADRKLFTVEILKPLGTAFASVSQHYLSAAAARGLLLWMAKVAQHFATTAPTVQNLQRAGMCLGLQGLQNLALEHGRVG